MKNLALALIAFLFVTVSSVEALGRPATREPAQRQVEAGSSRPVTQEVFELVLRDGSRVFGTVERETDQEVVFRTSAGSTVNARRADIVRLRRVKGRVDNGEFLRTDEHRSRLFFAPTGRALERGQVSVGVFQFMAPFVQVGVTDRLSVGGGTPLIFGIDDWDRPFWLTPKLQVYDGAKSQAAIGVLHIFDTNGNSAGIGYGVSTFGSTDNAVTVGAGVAYAGDDRGGILMIGGERRVRSNLKLITENYVWKGGDGFISGGVRFIGERLSADLALAFPMGMGDLVAFPVVNFVYVF